MEQKELKEIIIAEMKWLGYTVIPTLSDTEVLDITGWSLEKKQAYFQNLSKNQLQKELDAWAEELINKK